MSLTPILSEHSGQPQLLPDISVTPLYHFLPVLSALFPSLLDFINAFFFFLSLLFFLTDCQTPALLWSCIFSNYIHSPALQSTPSPSPLSFQLFCISSYFSTMLPTDLPFPQLWFAWHFLLPPSIALSPASPTSASLSFRALLPPEINPATGRLSQNRNCIVYLSPTLTFSCTQSNDCLLFLFSSSLLILCREQAASAKNQPVSGVLGG